tara:strand:+ start:386 stop:655 length:270 start_codon:yes stop_codon:yes gene_type:complete
MNKITCKAVTAYKLQGRNLSKPLIITIEDGVVTHVEDQDRAEDQLVSSIGYCQKVLWQLIVAQTEVSIFPKILKKLKKKLSAKVAQDAL